MWRHTFRACLVHQPATPIALRSSQDDRAPMAFLALLAVTSAPQAPAPVQLGSLYETLVRGGPVMIPLGLCSLIALTWILERSVRMRAKVLGGRAQAEQLVAAARNGGPEKALELARAHPTVLSKIFETLFERWRENRPTLEKAVEDSGSRELRALTSSLRPLTVIAVTAPLLGLFGTIIGIIIAFRDIALSNAMGKPEALATGIAQALVTTASGLAVAIPAQASYYWFRGRIDRFWRLVEQTGEQVLAVHDGRSSTVASVTPTAPPPPASTSDAVEHAPLLAQGAA